MTKNAPLEQALCLKFCSYYKPGKNEALACRGYLIVERLMEEGKSLVFEDRSGDVNQARTDSLVNVLCLACDFHEQDCDFMQDRAARPCGGFVFLEKLLGSGVITIDDIR